MKPRSLAVASVLVLSIAGSACNPAQPAGPPQPPVVAANHPAKDVDPGMRPGTEKPADTESPDTGASDVPTPGKAAPNTVIADTIEGAPATDPRWIADNPALGKALLGLWTPDASGSIPASANTVFEKELLRSRLYINAGKKAPPTHQGNLVVYTDSQSLVNVDGAGSKPYGLPPGEIFQLALDMKMGVYLHYEGDGSVFHVIEKDELKAFIARLKKAP